MKHLIKYTFILLYMLPFFSLAQTNTNKHALRVNTGYAIYQNIDDFDFIGSGVGLWVGYERSLGKAQRFRISPVVGASFLDGRWVEEDGVLAFQTLNVKTMLYYDLIKLKKFRGVIGAGIQMTHAQGVIGSGGTLRFLGPSKYKDETMLSGGGHLGIRYDNGRKIIINILSINMSANSDFYYIYPQSGISIRL